MPRRPAKTLRLQLRLKRGRDVVLGPGRAELLERVARTGSISAAAREMKMSYRHAWLLLEYTREIFGERLVETAQGGPRGGGAKLTPAGRRILAVYRRMERRAEAAIRPDIEQLFGPAAAPRRSTADR